MTARPYERWTNYDHTHTDYDDKWITWTKAASADMDAQSGVSGIVGSLKGAVGALAANTTVAGIISSLKGAIGKLETLAANMAPTSCCTDPLDDQDVTTGWSPGYSAILDSVTGGETGYCLEIKEGGQNNPYCTDAISCEEGKLYKISFSVKAGTEATWRVYVVGGQVRGFTSGQEATGEWVKHHFYFHSWLTGGINLVLMNMAGQGTGDTLYFDNVSAQEVTECAQLSVTGAIGSLKHIASASMNALSTVVGAISSLKGALVSIGATTTTSGVASSLKGAWITIAATSTVSATIRFLWTKASKMAEVFGRVSKQSEVWSRKSKQSDSFTRK